MEIGRRIYFDIATGSVLVDTGERSGYVMETTLDYDISVYKALNERMRESFDYTELEYEQNAKDFAACNGYRINPSTKQLEFSYPDPNQPESEKPVYRKPLSEDVDELKQSVAELTIMIAQ
ncbi:hypothetical protein M5X00_22875 [Paenibacillus alvei]|uniref:Uncharacterized protein n=1 Tax=Paenibacillus alvei TaxID=44250 RepID=A0ABT4H880_PAEAL|nr:hypothetical protein [Paenibacillus alvei]EJW16269.1 hypothetical protein PAV_6c03500 [Paenibacillus alvei DSM 29]MCY9704401.1 hypothetical protein [Paenibacillus alvei]MCY9736137.1 hypothetical protein [Paenibacillus alvei]MCY9757092.1 hypothetical protein [Paenibacillus alvei]MCY9765191.1 hypothetical protein [Paenibacillus alvei]